MTPRFILGTTVMLAVALSFNALLTLAALDRLHEQSAISRFALAATLLHRDLQGGLAHASGGPTARTEALVRPLQEARKRLERDLSTAAGVGAARSGAPVAVSLAFPDGTIRYSTEARLVGTRIPESRRLRSLDHVWSGAGGGPRDMRYARSGDTYAITIPIGDGGESVIATAVVSLDGRLIAGDGSVRLRAVARTAVLALAIGADLLFLLWLWRLAARTPKQGLSRRGAVWVLVMVLGAGQGLSFVLNLATLISDYTILQGENVERVATQLKNDVQGAVQGGASLAAPSVEALLHEYRQIFRGIEDFALLGEGGGGPLGTVPRDDRAQIAAGIADRLLSSLGMPPLGAADSAVRLEIVQDGHIEGFVSATVAAETVRSHCMAILVDAVTVVLIVFLLSIEMAVLLLSRLDTGARSAGTPAPVDYKAMRPAIFLFLFGIDLSMSFLPLHMERLYEPLLGLSRDFVMGLPLSVEFLCVGIAIFMSGAWLDRRGWHEPFLCGLLLAAGGGLWSWLASDAIQFILSRALVGLGYGLTLLAAQGFVIRSTDSRTKAQGLAHLFAGLYAGSICGAATGAILAERFGYEAVFLIGSLGLLAVIPYTVLYLRSGIEARGPSKTPSGPRPTRTLTVPRFLLDRRILAVVLFSSMPASIAAVGFLNYFSPVYLSRMGASESTIGQVLMLFGICLTLLGPTAGRCVDASESKRLAIFVGGLLGSAAFLSFNVLQGVAAATVAVVLLGLSNSLVLSSQSAYVLKLEVTRELGEGKALGIFRATSRIGQMLGPVIFAWLMVATDIQVGITYFGLAYLVTALLFVLLTDKESEITAVRTA